MPTEGTKISGFSTFTTLDGLDYLLGNDVSDVSMPGVVTTKTVTLNALKSWLAIPADLSTDVASIQTALSTHNHDARYYTETESNSLLSGKSDVGHSHAISDVTGLTSSLSGKASVSHSHVISEVTGLQSAIDAKANTVHSHAISDVTGLQSAIDAKAATVHTHAIADTTGLQAALDSKASSSHTHIISNVTGLQAAIDAKANTSHVHAASDITSGVLSTARLGTGTPAAGTYVDGGTGAWTSLPSGGGGGSPGGANTQVQFNNSGAFGGSDRLTFDGSKLVVGASYPDGCDLFLNHTNSGQGLKLTNVGTGTTSRMIAFSGNSMYFPDSGGIVASKFTSAANGSSISASGPFWIFDSAILNQKNGSATDDDAQDAFSARPSSVSAYYRPFSYFKSSTDAVPSWYVDKNADIRMGKTTTISVRPVASIVSAWNVSTDATRTGDVSVSTDGYNGPHVSIKFRDTGAASRIVIPIANIPDAADDVAASALSPPVEVGGLYRTGSTLKIRVS